MGLFGSSAGMAQAGEGYGAPLSWADRLAILGAGLKDASPGSPGGNLMAIQQLMGARAQDAQKKALLAKLPGLFGGQAAAQQPPVMTAPGSGPTMKGPGEDGSPIGPAETPPTYAPQPTAASGPDWNRIAAAAPIYKEMGLDLAPSVEALKAGQPHLMVTPSGDTINDKDPSMAGRMFPTIEKGQIVLRDARGNPTGVMNLPGVSDAAAQTAGSVANAQEAAKAGFNLVDVPIGGRIVKMPASIAAPLLAQMAGRFTGGAGGVAGGANAGGVGGAPGGAGGGQFGVSLSPDEQALANARAATQGKNETDIAGAKSAMQQVDDQTNMIAQNLHDMLGETQDPITGKWVKTKPSMATGLSTGSATDLIEHVPFLNQQAKDLAAKIETVRNGTSFNSLQAIKNALSAAGDGGSGSIRMTDQTARMLGEINGSLNQNQSGPQFEDTIRRHLAQLETLSRDRHALFDSQYQGIRQTTPGQSSPTANYSNRSASSGATPPAPPDPRARAANTVYQTPKGPLKWTGTGWVQP